MSKRRVYPGSRRTEAAREYSRVRANRRPASRTVTVGWIAATLLVAGAVGAMLVIAAGPSHSLSHLLGEATPSNNSAGSGSGGGWGGNSSAPPDSNSSGCHNCTSIPGMPGWGPPPVTEIQSVGGPREASRV